VADDGLRKSDELVARNWISLRKKEARLPHCAEAGLVIVALSFWLLALAAAGVRRLSTQKQVVVA
jgi:hypothetical protein